MPPDDGIASTDLINHHGHLGGGVITGSADGQRRQGMCCKAQVLPSGSSNQA
jgi:hypothetical protein